VSAPKLTPWFPGDAKPYRPGVYERRGFGTCRFSLWDGSMWRWSYDSVSQAASASRVRARRQNCDWRGLAEEPKV
jgi:hypothetical protein